MSSCVGTDKYVFKNIWMSAACQTLFSRPCKTLALSVPAPALWHLLDKTRVVDPLRAVKKLFGPGKKT